MGAIRRDQSMTQGKEMRGWAPGEHEEGGGSKAARGAGSARLKPTSPWPVAAAQPTTAARRARRRHYGWQHQRRHAAAAARRKEEILTSDEQVGGGGERRQAEQPEGLGGREVRGGKVHGGGNARRWGKMGCSPVCERMNSVGFGGRAASGARRSRARRELRWQP